MKRLPTTYTPRDVELTAITKIFDAYMACNACPDTLEWEVTPGLTELPGTAMGYLAEAGRTAWRQLLGDGAERLWGEMVESGEGALHIWNCYVQENDL